VCGLASLPFLAVGITPTDLLVEVQRPDLVAEYVGQTGPKTQKKVDEAAQGVLFIDGQLSVSPGRQMSLVGCHFDKACARGCGNHRRPDSVQGRVLLVLVLCRRPGPCALAWGGWEYDLYCWSSPVGRGVPAEPVGGQERFRPGGDRDPHGGHERAPGQGAGETRGLPVFVRYRTILEACRGRKVSSEFLQRAALLPIS
jgi:hypothetical protein